MKIYQDRGPRYIQKYKPEVQMPKGMDLAKFSAALLEQGEKSGGSLGFFVALGGVMFLAAACGSAPAAGPEASHTPTPTPDNPTPLPTHTLTPTSTHTFVPTSTLFPSRTPTFSAPKASHLSQYSADKNGAVDVKNSIARLNRYAYRGRVVNSYDALNADPKHYNSLDYEAARRYNKPPTDFWGTPKLPEGKMLDWWEKEGGLGFTPDDPNYFGMAEVLDAPLKSMLAKSPDGLHRAGLVVQQEYFEIGLIKIARSAAQLRFPSEDFSKFGPGSALAKHDSEIKALFNQMLTDSGYEPVGGIIWPGPVDLKTLTEAELEQVVPDGNVCVEERPNAGIRDQQKPERFRKVAYRAQVEDRTLANDETRNLADAKTDVVELAVFDPKAPWLKSVKVVIEDAGVAPDVLWPERIGQNVSDDKEVTAADGEFGEWRPCGPAQPGIESSQTPTSTTPPDVKVSRTPPKGVTPTSPNNTTPGTPFTPEKTQPPVTPGTGTTPPEITRVTPAPSITSQPPIQTSTPGGHINPPTAVATPANTPAPAETPRIVPSQIPQPAATKTPSAP